MKRTQKDAEESAMSEDERQLSRSWWRTSSRRRCHHRRPPRVGTTLGPRAPDGPGARPAGSCGAPGASAGLVEAA